MSARTTLLAAATLSVWLWQGGAAADTPPGFELTEDDLTSIAFECRDGVDNEGDGHADFPDDADCADADDEAERAPTPLRGRRVTFTPLRAPGGDATHRVTVSDVSRNGRVKVGILHAPDESTSVVWRGRHPRIIHRSVPPPVGGELEAFSYATGVSDDGREVVGYYGDGLVLGSRGYVWRGGRFRELEAIPFDGGAPRDVPVAVSDTGVVVGRAAFQPVRWDAHGGLVLDPEPFIYNANSSAAYAAGITPDGSVTVGSAHASVIDPEFGLLDWPYAARWLGSDPRPVPLLDALLDGRMPNQATDVSDDGRVIVGSARVPIRGHSWWGNLGFRWTEEEVQWIGVLPDPYRFEHFPTVWSTSGDGSISVAFQDGADGAGPVVLAGGKLRSLVDLLENEYGVDLPGWDLAPDNPWPAMISGDGRTLVGHALRPGDLPWAQPTAYEVRLPPPCADGLDNDGDGLVDHPDDRGCWGPGDGSEDRPRRRRPGR